jgi:hypothetical protein
MRYKKYLIFEPGPMDRVYYFWETLLMKKYLLFLLLAVMAGQVSGQLIIYGSDLTFSCAGGGASIQSSSGPGIGFFWQVSMDNGNTWTTLSDTGPYTGSSTGDLQIEPVAVFMNGFLYRYGATSNPTVFSNVDTLAVFATNANTPVFVSPVTSVCQGQTIVYTVTGNLTGDSSAWSITNGNSLYGGGINDTVTLVNFPIAGSATVYAYANNGGGHHLFRRDLQPDSGCHAFRGESGQRHCSKLCDSGRQFADL